MTWLQRRSNLSQKGRTIFYAHSTKRGDKRNWQGLAEHLLAVAELAESFGRRIGIGRAAMLAGLLHDLGKYNPDFQSYIDGHGGSVDHSTAGAAIARGRLSGDDRIIGDLIARRGVDRNFS